MALLRFATAALVCAAFADGRKPNAEGLAFPLGASTC
jgi:hypothetical protein